jgi:hypothetical protein
MVEVKRLRTPADFWREILKPDCDAYFASPADLRLALHAAISLFHMHDWIFASRKAQVCHAFAITPGKDARASKFANALEQVNDDFGRIRSVANAAKHLALDNRRPVQSPANSAANTLVQSTGWGEGGYGKGPYGGGPRVVVERPQGVHLEFIDIAESVLTMWETLNRRHGWW